MIKYMGPIAREKFQELLNEPIKKTQIPKDWHAEVILLYYKEGDLNVCSNYRRITLTSIPS